MFSDNSIHRDKSVTATQGNDAKTTWKMYELPA
jgi:hypothetical protein